ncbi:4'-phosphopantetheinyl transferase superfamily protein [bacterium]|nr:4'-phosphopantetheinyl transferase superfamily protein [bacterium]
MLGIDLVDINQIKSIYRKHGILFLKKILNDGEIKDLSRSCAQGRDLPLKENLHFFQRLSCYIASKEAIFKACSEADLDWKDISIRNITKDPLIYIRERNLNKKIRLTFSVNGNMVLAQALLAQNLLKRS